MNQSHSHQLTRINITIVFIASFMVWLSSFSPIYQKIDNWLSDTAQYYSSTEAYFDDVIVIDIDDDSLSDLTQYLGVWPYKRSDYALVLDYLYELGAEAVIFDILFVDKRPGDNVLSHAIYRHPGTVIVGTATKFITEEKQRFRAKEGLYEKLSWTSSPSPAPSTILPNVLLPQSIFFNSHLQDTNVGIVAVSADADGILRKMPIIYSIGKNKLPSLSLSAIRANTKGDKTLYYNANNQHAIYQTFEWPIDQEGKAHLYYPKNANAVLSFSFKNIVKPALGVSEKNFVPDLFKGKTVFIGSTAIQSDMVNTPRGMMGGTYLLSIAYQNLKYQLLLRPNQFWLDALVYIMALIPAFIIISRKKFTFRKDTARAAAVGLVIIGFNILLLSQFSQKSNLLYPLMILFSTGAMFVFHYSVMTKKRNVELNRLMDELTESNRQLEITATTDSLTGLYNRRAFLSSLNDEIERYQRSGNMFTVAIMDLDHFKKINDTYGHQVGDDVIVGFSTLMKNLSRQIDVAARWGGEEFVMLLPNTDSTAAMTFFERLRKEIENMTFPSAPECKVTVSIGLIDSTAEVIIADEHISNADIALYEAKNSGRNRICTFIHQR